MVEDMFQLYARLLAVLLLMQFYAICHNVILTSTEASETCGTRYLILCVCLPFHALYRVGENITALKACTTCKKSKVWGIWEFDSFC